MAKLLCLPPRILSCCHLGGGVAWVTAYGLLPQALSFLALQEDQTGSAPWPATSNQQTSALAAVSQHEAANVTLHNSECLSGPGIMMASCDPNQLKARIQLL